MKKEKKGFTLLLLLLFMSAFTVITLSLLTFYHNVMNNHFVAQKKIQASNYSAEGIELVKGYLMTEVNKDRIGAWGNKILPLSGNYKISFQGGEYLLEPLAHEIIEVDEPFVFDFKRTISIVNGDSNNEKKVTVTVDYGENTNISYETTLANLYGE